jgi:hypothetical protein
MTAGGASTSEPGRHLFERLLIEADHALSRA